MSTLAEKTKTEETKTTEASLTKDLIHLVRYYLGGRRSLILLTMATLGAGAALNWGWLVAIGAAPLLLLLAPCAVMCGLGLCMKGGGKSGSSGNQSVGTNTSTAVSVEPREDA